MLVSAAAMPGIAAGPEDLQQVEQQLESDRARAAALEAEQRKAAEELNGLRREAIAVAKKAQLHEARLVDLDARLTELAARENEARAALHARNAEMTGTLAAMQRMAQNPPQTMLAFRDAPTRMVRSAMLLRAALPRVRAKADVLAAELETLRGIRAETKQQLASLAAENAELERQRAQLTDVLGRKAALLKDTESQTREINRRVQELAQQAASIRDLLEQIQAERKRQEEEDRKQAQAPGGKPTPPSASALVKPAGIRPFPAKGPVIVPTSAPILRNYGERSAQGLSQRGMTFATRPGAQIVSPHDGLIAFAGPFEGYGQILIIEHDGGYHTLLAGLGRLDVSVGQWVLAGEPVGAMGAANAMSETGGLYVELRRAGQPINPWGWFAGAIQNRTSG